MLGFRGPAQPSPTLGDALNVGYLYLEVWCLGCDTHQTVALDVVRRPKTTPIHELERYMRCKDCSQVRGYVYKRSHLVALRHRKISASDPPSTWWPGEREWPHTQPKLDRVETAGSTTGKPGCVPRLLAVAARMSTTVVTAHRMRPCRTRAGWGYPRDQKRESRSYK
jgi:hypothetical protein